MGRKKQMVKHMIENRRSKTQEDGEESREKTKELLKPINEEEHNKRVDLLKSLGLLKEE